jgi:1-acyl-sn-glycerol-3-phosphate acyltransferase
VSSVLADVRQVAKGWRWTRRPLAPRSVEPEPAAADQPEFPTDWARSPAARTAREVVLRYGFKPLVWSQLTARVEGLDHLRDVRAPAVFVSNHSSHVDTPLILCSLPKRWRERTAVGAAADYFFDVWWRAATSALAFNTFPIERTGGPRSTETARRLLSEGWSLLVFPEGTRSKDGWLGPWRHGAARLAAEFGAPVVPVVVRGSFSAMPRGRGWPKPGRPPVSVRFGPAVHPEHGEDYHDLSRRMTAAVARVADEDASDWYRSLRRAADDQTPSLKGPEAPRWRRVWTSTAPTTGGREPRVWRAGAAPPGR